MHHYNINAAIQVVPIGRDRHPYEWVDETIEIIQKAGLPYEVGPFSTVIEGKYEEVLKVINDINAHLYKRNCPEWITNVQIQIRSNGDITALEKVEKYR